MLFFVVWVKLSIFIYKENYMENEVIYKISSPKGKVYIGRTKNFNGRMAEHKHNALTKKQTYPIHKAIRKYGWDNMIKEIICEVEPEKAQKLEEEFILAYDAVKKGYNSTYGGGGGNMFKDNPELLEKLRQTLSKRFSGVNNGMYGKTHSDESRDKLKERAKGRFTLDWYKERNGDVEGERLYEERRVWLKSRNLKKDENGRFLKAK
jgi:group I intron endonuclease